MAARLIILSDIPYMVNVLAYSWQGLHRTLLDLVVSGLALPSSIFCREKDATKIDFDIVRLQEPERLRTNNAKRDLRHANTHC